MSEPKPMASLTGSLLARKGAARPAMRSSLHAPDPSAQTADDLGWNDFGAQHQPQPAVAQVVPLTPEIEIAPAPEQPEPPAVVIQQQALQDAVPTVPVDAPAARVARPRKSALAQGRRAAFTLRLDAERHLALRVAATVLGRSAQQIVSDALDEVIARNPEIHDIAGQIHGRR